MAGRRKSRPAAAAAAARPAHTLVLDNGGYTLKAGFAGGDVDASGNAPRVVPNCIARDRARRIYVGSGLARCRDFGEMQFRRPVEKGYVVGWEAQKEIWDHELFDDGAPLRCDPADTRLLLAEPPNGLPALQSNCDQIVFEEYGFASYYRAVGPAFNAYHDVQSLFFHMPRDEPWVAPAPAEVLLVVDAGYSHTTVTPLLRGRPLHSAVRRLDVGGKFLTNYLARLVSLRHFDVRAETYIVNEMKEAACFVSVDFAGDLERTWKGTRPRRCDDTAAVDAIVKDYVLPDFHARATGELRDHDAVRLARAHRPAAPAAPAEDVVTLRNERFAVPELLFSPSDVGLGQPGLADLIHQSLQELPLGLWPGLLANIVAVGGSTLFDGFVQRLRREVVQRVPDDCVVRVARAADPVVSTWAGAANMASHADVERAVVTKGEYEELGAALVARRFAAGIGPP